MVDGCKSMYTWEWANFEIFFRWLFQTQWYNLPVLDIGPPFDLTVPSMICSNFYRPRNKICYLYLPNVNFLTERPCYPAQDYSEAATVHGVSYICQRDQSTFHRILWLVIFSMGVPKIVMMRRIKIPICCISVSQLKLYTLYKLSSPTFSCLWVSGGLMTKSPLFSAYTLYSIEA